MSLSIEQVQHIANLARLELTDEEIARYREQISSILNHFEELQTLDTSTISPTSNVSTEESRLRCDQSRPGLSIEELLRNAPDTVDQQFRVPPIFE